MDQDYVPLLFMSVLSLLLFCNSLLQDSDAQISISARGKMLERSADEG
jgi:hypothetical protein